MKNRKFLVEIMAFITAIAVTTTVLVVSRPTLLFAAPPTPINRALTVMSYLRNQTSGDTIVPVDAATADKWVEFFYDAYGPILDGNGDPVAYADLTNLQKGTFYLDQLREWHRDVRKGNIRRDASTASDEAAADLNTAIDLGNDKS